MNERTRWATYYLISFCLEAFIFALYARGLPVSLNHTEAYIFLLDAILSFIFLFPFFIVTWIGFGGTHRPICRAIGTGFLFWVLLTDPNLIIASANIFTNARLLIYLFDVAVGLLFSDSSVSPTHTEFSRLSSPAYPHCIS